MNLSNFDKPKRKLSMSVEDEELTNISLDNLEKSYLDTNELFKIFDEWQSKRTLTTKRILVSTSVLVTMASWVGVDFNKLSFFGMKVSEGSPLKFIVFIIAVIFISGIFFYFSRKIDSSIRNAKIFHINNELESLHKHVVILKNIIENNNIKSFSALFYDFKPTVTMDNNTIQAYNTIWFYYNNLISPKKSRYFISVIELIVIYGLGVFSIIALATSIITGNNSS